MAKNTKVYITKMNKSMFVSCPRNCHNYCTFFKKRMHSLDELTIPAKQRAWKKNTQLDVDNRYVIG